MSKSSLIRTAILCGAMLSAAALPGAAADTRPVCGAGQILEFRATTPGSSDTNFAMRLSGATTPGMTYYDDKYIVVFFNEANRWNSEFALAHAAFLSGTQVKVFASSGKICTIGSKEVEIRVCSPADTSGCQASKTTK